MCLRSGERSLSFWGLISSRRALAYRLPQVLRRLQRSAGMDLQAQPRHPFGCLHRLVELPDWTHPEQHYGVRAMTASFRRFAFCLRVCVPDTLRDRALTGSCAVHRLSDDRCRASGYAPFARHRRPVDGEFSTRDALVRLDCDGRVGRAHIRLGRSTFARTVVAAVLVRRSVGDCRGRNDWVCLPHAALVSTLAKAEIAPLTDVRFFGHLLELATPGLWSVY